MAWIQPELHPLLLLLLARTGLGQASGTAGHCDWPPCPAAARSAVPAAAKGSWPLATCIQQRSLADPPAFWEDNHELSVYLWHDL